MPSSTHPHQMVDLAPEKKEKEKKRQTLIWAKKCEIATSSVNLLFMGGLWWHTGENIFPNSEVDHPK